MKILIAIILTLCLASIVEASTSWTLSGHLPIKRGGELIVFDSVTLYNYSSDTTSIFKSTNAGKDWTEIHYGGIQSLVIEHLSVVRKDLLLAYYSRTRSIVSSADGGKTWKTLFAIPDAQYLVEFSMINTLKGTIIYKDTNTKWRASKTIDGAITFTNMGIDSLLNFSPYFSNIFPSMWAGSFSGFIWSGGQSKYLVSKDDGISWRLDSIISPTGNPEELPTGYFGQYGFKKSTFCISPLTFAHYFYYSTDAGDHWEHSDTINTQLIGCIEPSTPNELWAAGPRDILGGSVFLHTTNYGTNWDIDLVSAKEFNSIRKISFPDENHGFATAYRSNTNNDDTLFLLSYKGASSEVKTTLSQENIFLYPNPCSEFIKIDVGEGGNINGIELFDILGLSRSIDCSINGTKAEINTKNLSKGLWTVVIHDKSRMIRETFIKSR